MKWGVFLLLTAVLFCNSCKSSDPSANNFCSVADCICNENGEKTSSAMLCKNCMAKILSNNKLAYRFNKVREQLIKMGGVGSTKLTDLNDDVMMTVFDFLSMDDIFNLLEAFPVQSFAAIVRDCFRSRYKDHTVRIDEDLTKYSGINFKSEFKPNGIDVYIDRVPDFLRYFGDLFNSLYLRRPSKLCIHYINKYASNSFRELFIDDAENALQHFTKPWENVDDLSIRIDDHFKMCIMVKSGSLSMAHIFPNIKRLSVTIRQTAVMNFMFCSFPKLEYFSFRYVGNSEEQIMEFFKLNPTIKTLRVFKVDKALIINLGRYLPNLETLILEYHNIELPYNMAIISVKNVQIYAPSTIKADSKLTFPNLEWLQIWCVWDISNVWTDFFKKHTHLTHLRMLNVFQEDDQLIQLLNELQNLKKIEFDGQSYPYDLVTPETISQIIRSHEKLETFNFTRYQSNESKLSNLRGEFENEWNFSADYYQLKDVDHVNLVLERKN